MRYATGSHTEEKLTTLVNAAQYEPVFIQQGETDVAVLVSVREYDRLRNAVIRELQDFCDATGDKAAAAGLTEKKLDLMLRNA